MRKLNLFLLLLLMSCSPVLEKIEVPENLIEREKFTSILQDMMLLEAHVQSKYENVTKYYNLIQNSAKEIFIKYDIDSLSYATSMDYYSKKQEILKEIYIEVQNNVNQMRMDAENK